MGVGSEVYNSVKLGRRAIGVELKDSYYAQAVENLKSLRRLVYDENTFLPVETYDPTYPGQDVTGDPMWEEIYDRT